MANFIKPDKDYKMAVHFSCLYYLPISIINGTDSMLSQLTKWLFTSTYKQENYLFS